MAKDHSPQKLRKLKKEKQTTIEINRGSDDSKADVGLMVSAEDSKHRRNLIIAVVVSLLILLACMLFPSGLLRGYSDLDTAAKVLDQFSTNVRDFFAALAGTGTAGFYDATICRYCLAFIGGAALGACGAVLQGSFKNPLASPSTMGVVAGCLMGAVVYYLFLLEDYFPAASMSMSEVANTLTALNPLEYVWVIYGRAICATIGGLLVVGIAVAVSKAMGGGSLNNVVIIVIGQVFNLVLDSTVDTVRYYLQQSGQYQRATFVQRAECSPFDIVSNFGDLAFSCIPILIGLAVLFLLRNRINALTFSDEEARSFGVNVGRFRTGVLILCTFLMGTVVAYCGPVAFVGFVAPHMVRRVVGTNFKYLLPASMASGAILLTVSLFAVSQVDLILSYGINLVTSIIGCIVFIVVVFIGRGGAYDWR